MVPTNMSNAVIVIMAGGAGERFWPLSNRETPKQLLRLHGDATLLEAAFDRAARLTSPERVYVVAGEKLRPAILKCLPNLPEANYIAEPFARNTAACLGLAACHIALERGRATVMGVLTADHLIEEGPAFERAAQAALAHAAAADDLVTIGVAPTRPDTGFGYLELGLQLATAPTAHGDEPVYRVKQFREKPDATTAECFLSEGGFLWNSGMFFWRVETLLAAFESQAPAMAAAWRRLLGAGALPFPEGLAREVFESVPSRPIDIAIMERSPNVAAVAGRFAWEDVGSWDALARVRPLDEEGNCSVGAAIVLDSQNNIVYNDAGGNNGGAEPVVVLHGVEDLIVIRTGKAILVTPRSRAQSVKEVVKSLAARGREDLL